MRNLLSLKARVGYCLVVLSYVSSSFGLVTLQSGESKIALEVTETISLRPFINMVVKKTEKSDLLYCYQQLQNETYFVDARRIVRIIPEIFDYLVSKQDVLEEISCGVIRTGDNHVCAVISAVQWLSSLKTALNEMKFNELADAETIVSLSYLLDAYFDDMSLRALEDEGARQIIVGVRTILDSVDSKIDVIDDETEIIDSKIGEFDAVSTDTGYFNTVESIDGAELSVLEWLKSIMRELKSL